MESSSAAWTLMAALVSEKRVWRELTHFHFSAQQIELIQQKYLNERRNSLRDGHTDNMDRSVDWQRIYHALRR